MEAYFSGDIPPLKKGEALVYGNCEGIFSVRAYLHYKKSGGIPMWKLWRHIFNIPPLKKVEVFLYGNCGGIFSDRAHRHSKKVEAPLYGNCNVALNSINISIPPHLSSGGIF